METEWHKHILYTIRHPFFLFDCKKSDVNHICISVFLSCFLCVIFFVAIHYDISSRLSMQNEISSFCKRNHFVVYFCVHKNLDTVFVAFLSFDCRQPIYSNVCSTQKIAN